MDTFDSLRSVAQTLRPDLPQPVFRPAALRKAARYFTRNFQGEVMYAVKTNPQAHVLQALYHQGVRSFDVASLPEARLVHRLFPDAQMYFMHTVKSRQAIREAYYELGVRAFSLDTEDELNKILQETGHARDLKLFVRLAIPNSYAELSLANKFGINLADAVDLLRKTRKASTQVGVCFHVGSQCMHPDAYRIAIRMAWQVVRKSRVKIDFLDIGGGFPSIYPGMTPPPMEDFFRAIHEEFMNGPTKGEGVKLLCEPGRALVAESGSVMVKVELRKEGILYINDGTYGSLFDAGTPQFIFPTKLLREDGSNNTMPFSFFGPTCDTLDFMKGPFFLPEDVAEGDYIEIGQLGAYSHSMNTAFNGFGEVNEVVAVKDAPLMSMYQRRGKEQDLLMAA